MAKEHSFDISAKIDMQLLKNAINMVDREVSNRYDFKGTTYEITHSEKANTLVLIASSDNKLDALKDMVIAKLLKQNLSSKVLDELKVEDSSGGNRKVTFKVVDYIESKEAKKIVADMKDQNVKDMVAAGKIPEIVAIIAYMNSLK